MAEEEKMSKQQFALAYNGESRTDLHTMDVETLGSGLIKSTILR